MKISANLGFLYTDQPLPQAINAAAVDGFDAVECHFPYDQNPQAVKAALTQTGMTMLGLNTVRGNTDAGDFGLSALPDRQDEAKAAIDQALEYAIAINAQNVHVMAGITDQGVTADAVFRENLTYASIAAAPHGIGILIEPINRRNVPDYHLSTVEHGASIIKDIGQANLRLMFDCYHTQIMQGDLIEHLRRQLPIIGHVQIAAVPDRGEPNMGELSFPGILLALRDLGYSGAIGAEYVPRDGTSCGELSWLDALKAI